MSKTEYITIDGNEAVAYVSYRLNEIMAKHTGQSIEVVERDTDRDNFLSAEDSLKYGIIDKILESRHQL